MSISNVELTNTEVSSLLNSIHYYEVTRNEDELKGVTELIWEKLRSLQFTRPEKTIVKELCRQFVDKQEIDHIQNGLIKIIHFTDPKEERVIRKLQYISSKLGTKKKGFLLHLVPSSYWTRSVIEEAYRSFSNAMSNTDILQTEYFDVFQSAQRILEKFEKTEPFQTPLSFALLCMQEASNLNLSIEVVERCFLAFLDERINRRQIDLNQVDSLGAFHFCMDFMLSFQSRAINPIYQRYMESKQKKRSTDPSWQALYRKEKIKQDLPSLSDTSPESKTHFHSVVRRLSLSRNMEDQEVAEERLEQLPPQDVSCSLAKTKTSPKSARVTLSFDIYNGAKYLQKIKEWRLESDAEGIQHLMDQLDQEEATLSPKEHRFYLYAKKRILDIQGKEQTDVAKACDLFIRHYQETLEKIIYPATLYDQIPLQNFDLPRTRQLVFAALRKDEEWLQNEYAQILSFTPQASSLEPEELSDLEETIDLLAESSEKNLVAKYDWYAQIFGDLDFSLFTQILSFQGVSKGDVYEIIKPKIETLTSMKKIREEEKELLNERSVISKKEFNQKMRRIQERERGVRDVIFSLIMSQEYFTHFHALQSFFSDGLCSYLTLLNGNASIYFPDRLKAILREYNLMRSFFE